MYFFTLLAALFITFSARATCNQNHCVDVQMCSDLFAVEFVSDLVWQGDSAVSWKGVKLNFSGGRSIDKKASLLKVLRYLYDNHDRIILYEEIISAIWPSEFNSDPVAAKNTFIAKLYMLERMFQNADRSFSRIGKIFGRGVYLDLGYRDPQQFITLGELHIYKPLQMVYWYDQKIRLSTTHYDMLSVLAHRPGECIDMMHVYRELRRTKDPHLEEKNSESAFLDQMQWLARIFGDSVNIIQKCQETGHYRLNQTAR